MGLLPRNQWGPLTRWPSANTASQRGGTPLLSLLSLLVCSVSTQEYFWIKYCVKGQIFLNTKVQNIPYIKQDCNEYICNSVQWLVQCKKNQDCMNWRNNLLYVLTTFTNRCTRKMYIARWEQIHMNGTASKYNIRALPRIIGNLPSHTVRFYTRPFPNTDILYDARFFVIF